MRGCVRPGKALCYRLQPCSVLDEINDTGCLLWHNRAIVTKNMNWQKTSLKFVKFDLLLSRNNFWVFGNQIFTMIQYDLIVIPKKYAGCAKDIPDCGNIYVSTPRGHELDSS